MWQHISLFTVFYVSPQDYSPHYVVSPAGYMRGGRTWRLSWQQCGQHIRILTALCDFPCRLYERRKKMEAKLAAVRAAAEHPVDPATGRLLFQPAIGRAPHYRRNQHGLPVGEYLYGMR